MSAPFAFRFVIEPTPPGMYAKGQDEEAQSLIEAGLGKVEVARA